MDPSRQLVRLGDFARKDGLPFARDLLRRARGALDGVASTLLGRDLEERLRRVSQELAPTGVDPFGWDPDYARYVIAAATALSRSYFRTVVSGIEKMPAGRVILVANHSGQIPLDGVTIAISVFLEADPPRIVRAMVEKWSQTLPFVSTFFAKCGQVVGVPENATLLLQRGEPLLVFPEGTKGLAKTFQHRYELTDFGLGFMRLALATDTPILPVAVIGAEEQYISVANMKSVAKALHMPSFPILPQLFLPGGALPLPTRYRIQFGDPLYFRGDPDDDDAVIEEKVWVVKATIQSMLNRGLTERKSLFFLMSTQSTNGRTHPTSVSTDTAEGDLDGTEAADSDRGAGLAASSTQEPAVVITGIVGRLGRRLARRMHRDRRVIGIDRRPFDGRPKDIEHYQIDIRRKKTRDVFRSTRISAVVHLGVMHDPRASAADHHTWNVAGFQKILEYVALYQIPKIVLLSSANVYGPRPDNPQFLSEDAPLLGGAAFSEIRDLVEVDMLAQSFFWKHPEIETVILRPVHIVGTVRNAPSNYLRLNVIPTLLGFDPMVQVIHEEDLVRAIGLALRPGVRGIFNLAGPAPAPLSRIIKATGRATVPIPHALAAPMLAPLWRLRMASFPVPELDHVRYVCMVDDGRARATLGYAPTKTLEESVRAVSEGLWE